MALIWTYHWNYFFAILITTCHLKFILKVLWKYCGYNIFQNFNTNYNVITIFDGNFKSQGGQPALPHSPPYNSLPPMMTMVEVLSKLMRTSDENLLAHYISEDMESLTGDLPSLGFEIEKATSHMGCQLFKFPPYKVSATI